MAVSGGGNRPTWEQLPAHVRSAICALLGSEVRTAASQPGGFTPGFASRVTLADGSRAFVKAGHGSQNPHVPIAYSREAEIIRQLPSSVPSSKLIGSVELADGWQLLAFHDVDGRNPHEPWTVKDLDRVLDALTILSERLTPSPMVASPIAEELREDFSQLRMAAQLVKLDELKALSPWLVANLDQLAAIEADWERAAEGDSLLHLDIRADNIMLTDTDVIFIDWNLAIVGAPWVDLLGLLPSVLMHGGFDGEQIVRTHPLTREVDPEQITPVLVALMGYFVISSFQPAPKGVPAVRAFQRRQGMALADWLQHRI